MANKIVDNLIDEMSDAQIDTLLELQDGRPESMVNDNTVESLDDRDLVNRIQFTSTRSKIAIPGWALSERGNQVAEEVRRRETVHAFSPANKSETANEARTSRKKTSTKKDKKSDSTN